LATLNDNLSREAAGKIDKMVERVALKAGYTGRENMTYKEHLQAKFEQKRSKAERKLNKYKHKFSLKPSNADFAEEIRTYLQDGLHDLMKEGHSEEEALRITMEKFDEAELKNSFDDFAKEFGGFGMEEFQDSMQWYSKNGEAIGLFYAAFIILGLVIGALAGYFIGHTWLTGAIGLAVGLFTGVGCGLLSNAIITLKRGK
jgi:F0F1-type ATP synthase assembly protein I